MRAAICSVVFLASCTVALPVFAQLDPAKVALAVSVREELDSLPEGLHVTHSPNPVSALENSTGGTRYTWKYATLVSPLSDNMTIVEFGVLSQVGQDWVYANYSGKPFGVKEFAEWYGCEGARLHAGQAYNDPSNWSSAGCLKSGTALWYFIAEDESGRRCKGVAEINLSGEVLAPKN